MPAGSLAPLGTAVQVPAEPDRLQEKQLAVQALWQQTPWAQKPEAHSAAAEHTEPGGFRPQELLVHTAGLTHWAFEAQLLPQAAPLQRNGAQEVDVAALHWPP